MNNLKGDEWENIEDSPGETDKFFLTIYTEWIGQTSTLRNITIKDKKQLEILNAEKGWVSKRQPRTDNLAGLVQSSKKYCFIDWF